MRLSNLSYALLGATLVESLVIVDSSLATACIYYHKTFDWGCNSHSNGMKAYRCRCLNRNWVGTVTNCIISNSNSTKTIDHALKHVVRRCFEMGDVIYTLEDMYQAYEQSVGSLRDPTPFDLDNPVNTTLAVDHKEFDWYYIKFKEFTSSVVTSQWFGWGLVFYWCAVLVIATLFNFLHRFLRWSPLRTNWMKKHIILPSVYKDYHERTYLFAKLFPLDFPTRLQWLVVAGFIIQTVISCCVGYNVTLPHPYTNSQWFMDLDLVSYRVDLMSFSLFPVIYFFGIRNNPFIPLTGMAYATFSFYHKWCSYVCCMLAFIHSVIWTVYACSAEGGGYTKFLATYWNWGIVGTTLIVLLVFHSDKIIRRLTYEFFLFLHKVFNILFIVAMYYHVRTLGWLNWVWSMVFIVSFDRCARISRILLCGGVQTANLSEVGGGVIKMTIKRPKYFKYYPGSFVYVYFLSSKDQWIYPFQSHPFTVISASEFGKDKLYLYFKAQKGITQRLLERILISEKDQINYNLLLEGPYGNSIPNLTSSDRRYVGISAGLGVTAVYPHFAKLLKHESQLNHSFYWIINDVSCLTWFAEELKYLELRNCDVHIICTKSQEFLEETSSLDISAQKCLDSFSIEWISNRPDLNSFVGQEIDVSSKRSQDLTFISCGPSLFNDHLRHAARCGISKSLKIDVDLQEESFTW
ncbi:ferric/cupric-chelate reductase Ecym_8070 [Eremothecium cymbalariae DBVPG|uniref:ferric-chelate reductase (NADPH) n=1 Tax=Eremothecium cymbalariae (strain CBS 270.75 / DBVPG 7215 / KCTC 17166 / NRRL Y-17582) TaxID=931890 RepID=G8JWZ2_ERECY|nr:Hypothetical protein Ecym_8070 [Eremothecium cymbalariae DBVPG\